jgi:HAD superfamily hydrolase (TIGR01509 family)
MELDIAEFDAVIFDMDGVLIDSEPLWKIAMEEVFQFVGCPLRREDFQKTVGLRLDEVIHYWYEHTGWETYSPKEVEQRIVLRMVKLLEGHGEALIGVHDTLVFLQKKGIKIGLATSSYEVLIDTVLDTLKIRSFFDFTHSAEKEMYGKPHPAVYLTVAEKLQTQPIRCLVIEDSLNGIIAGRSARMKVVCIPEKTHFPEPKLMVADYHYEDMGKLLTQISTELSK